MDVILAKKWHTLCISCKWWCFGTAHRAQGPPLMVLAKFVDDWCVVPRTIGADSKHSEKPLNPQTTTSSVVVVGDLRFHKLKCVGSLSTYGLVNCSWRRLLPNTLCFYRSILEISAIWTLTKFLHKLSRLLKNRSIYASVPIPVVSCWKWWNFHWKSRLFLKIFLDGLRRRLDHGFRVVQSVW